MKKNVLIAHGGGPTPVINSSLAGALQACRDCGAGKVYGARHGAEGFIGGRLVRLDDQSPSTLDLLASTPASAIGSCRLKLGVEHYPALIECIRKYDVGCVLYTGGNDSMDTCDRLNKLMAKERMDVSVIGIPKTIDNDLAMTDHSPGFGSAARFAALCAAEIGLDAAALPIHVVVLELMGRNAGWITASAAFGSELSGCPQLTFLPEEPFYEDAFLSDVEALYSGGNGLLVVVSEGIRRKDGSFIADSGIVDGFGHTVPGGAGRYVAGLIMKSLNIKARDEKPGLLGRTCMGCISGTDRREAFEVGYFAAKSALAGKSGFMASIIARRDSGYSVGYELVPLSKVANVEKRFPAEWITPPGAPPHPEFREYCLPLMGEEFPRFASLR